MATTAPNGPRITSTQLGVLRWRLGKLKMVSEAAQLDWIRRNCGVDVSDMREIAWRDYEVCILPKLIEAETVPWRM